MRSSGACSGANGLLPRCRSSPRNSVAWPPAPGRCLAHVRSLAGVACTQRWRAVPFDQLRAGQVQQPARFCGTPRRHSACAGLPAREERQCAGRGRRPVGAGRAFGILRARRPAAGARPPTAAARRAGAGAACQRRPSSTQQLALSGSGWPPQRLSCAQRAGLVQLEQQRGLGRRHRQHLQRDLGDHAQRAQRAGHQARHVVAGHVLHHLAAEARAARRGR